MTNRLEILRIDPSKLLGLVTLGRGQSGGQVPADARIVGEYIDRDRKLVLIVESAEFAEVGPDHPEPDVRFFAPPTARCKAHAARTLESVHRGFLEERAARCADLASASNPGFIVPAMGHVGPDGGDSR